MLSNCGSKDGKQRNILLADARAAHPKARQLSRLEGYVHDVTWAPDGRTLGILYVIGDNHAVGATSAVKPRVGVIGVRRRRAPAASAPSTPPAASRS